MEIREILKLLPHRHPFLLIDRVLEADETRFRVLKNVTYNEPYFPGHFPDHPVMPGVLLLEAMAQAAVASLAKRPELKPGALAFLAGVEEARFKKPVFPGDTLILEGELLFFRRRIGKVRVRALVGEEERAVAVLTFALE
ncbi:3-hydroxyacyl-ACP dehydratase FabZ [Thermus filiformis]|uniref:3-hydroxyacyl-[acyl-carrier-protein] dehydratase n=1 Tax=Thermus filiformis TaxID=276 RepID=A0A0D6X9A2_THEFI|nr:3-hydroxyacyl-ACP dehydratase FabZ [Thermus filiformis]KIX84499.1 hydroxymyristoyl-ACP dehydratase [Thermus filiformis]